MLARSDIQRSVANMTLNLHKAITARAAIADAYSLSELEWQVQYEFSGNVGLAPVELAIEIHFEPTFVANAGMRRASALDRPLAHLGFELLSGPAGVIPYAHVTGWVYDDDGNYTGAHVTVGMHYPGYTISQTPASTAFDALLHARFQGYGAIWDPDGPYDAGASVDDAGTTDPAPT